MASKISELSYLDIFIQCVGCYTCITAIIELSHGSSEKQDRRYFKGSVLDFLDAVLFGIRQLKSEYKY